MCSPRSRPALRSVNGVDVLSEPSPGPVDILVIAIGATATDALAAGRAAADAGYSVRVVDPCWVTPVNPELIELARLAQLVVTVEDGVAVGGAGARIGQALDDAGVNAATRQVGIPTEFLEHGRITDVRAWTGMTVADIGRRIVEWSALVQHGGRNSTQSAADGAIMREHDDLDAN